MARRSPWRSDTGTPLRPLLGCFMSLYVPPSAAVSPTERVGLWSLTFTLFCRITMGDDNTTTRTSQREFTQVTDGFSTAPVAQRSPTQVGLQSITLPR